MDAPTGDTLSRLLDRSASGESLAAEQLAPVVYDSLHALARRHMRGGGGDAIMQTTVLVHEAYVRLLGKEDASWESRAHFFAVAATAMRQILASHARARGAAKRGGGRQRVTLSGVEGEAGDSLDLIAIHEAFEELEKLDRRQAEIVGMRVFAGMTVREVASVTGLSAPTVEREWRSGRAWLAGRLIGDGGGA